MGARDTQLAPLCSLNAESKLWKRHIKVRRASPLCSAARGKACPGAKSCSSHWQVVPACAGNIPQYTLNSGGRSCPFPGHPGTAPKLLPGKMWESRSCSLTGLVSPAGTGRTPRGGHSMMVLPTRGGRNPPRCPTAGEQLIHPEDTQGLLQPHRAGTNPQLQSPHSVPQPFM